MRVKVDMGSIIRSVDKAFNLSSNYPKVDGDAFKALMEEYHMDSLIAHAGSTNGNRKEILTQCAGPMH